MPGNPPTLSVVLPVRNGADFLQHSLPALLASDLPRAEWELIVVDDGSTDATAEVAAPHADRVIRLAVGGGPPRARNQGAAVARGSLLVFVDADVCVRTDALRRIRDTLAGDSAPAAVFGAYDLSPTAPDLLSQYRNLLHAYVHRRDAGEAVTFWTGLGGVRRDAFEAVGGLDEGERLDDVELGYRLAAAGHRIRLDPTIQGTHRKRWTLGNIIVTDVRDRGVPWMRLLMDGRHPAGRSSLNVRRRERLLTATMALAGAAAIAAAASGQPRWLGITAAALMATLLGDAEFLSWLAGRRGWWFVARAVPLRLLYYVLNVVSVILALLPVHWRRASVSAETSLIREAGA